MSSLPLISHRLFVAAIRTPGSPEEASSAGSAKPARTTRGADPIPLEVMASDKTMSYHPLRTLRASPSPGQC
jgi:hypothetical protein